MITPRKKLKKTPTQSAKEAWELLRAHERAWEKKEQAFGAANTRLQHELEASRGVNKELSKSYDVLKCNHDQWRDAAREADKRGDGFDEQIVAASDRYVQLTDNFLVVLQAYELLIAKVLKAEDLNKSHHQARRVAEAAVKAAEDAVRRGDESAQEMVQTAKGATLLLPEVLKRVNLIRPMFPSADGLGAPQPQPAKGFAVGGVGGSGSGTGFAVGGAGGGSGSGTTISGASFGGKGGGGAGGVSVTEVVGARKGSMPQPTADECVANNERRVRGEK